MTVKAIQMTDPAYEFSTLASRLSSHRSGDGTATYSVIADFIGVGDADPQLYELIGFIGSRSVSLINFIERTEDEYLDDELRANLVSSVQSMTQIISPQNFTTAWSQISTKFLKNHQILMLRQFSQTARRYRPLRLVSVDQRDLLIAQIDEAIIEAEEAEDVPSWTVGLITDGLRRLRTMIKYFDFFGHEAVLDHLLKINSEAEAVSSSLFNSARGVAGKFFKTAGVIATAVSIIVAPLKAQEAYVGYRGYMMKLAENPPALLAAPIKQLTGPSSTSTDPEAPEAPPFMGP